MIVSDLIRKNRSYRRFYQDVKIPKEELVKLIDLARLSPSARNSQPLKYFISVTDEINDLVFPNLAWAGYLKDWPGPQEGERPSAYIIVTVDKSISDNFYCDHGIATQSILLGAVEKGWGGCIIAAVKKKILHKILLLPSDCEILHVIALGKPMEKVVIDDVENNEIKYWRDEQQVHHVPKRSLQELIINF